MAPTALLSVSNKEGLVPLAQGLLDAGYRLISSGGTAAALLAAGLPVTKVADHTGAPEILGGRVKTLHPRIHGGILARRSEPAHQTDLAAQGIDPIDVVVVNLYPFRETVADPAVAFDTAIETIDIGGPAMVRAAAKNHADVAVLTSPAQYEGFLAVLKAGAVDQALRRSLALAAFQHTGLRQRHQRLAGEPPGDGEGCRVCWGAPAAGAACPPGPPLRRKSPSVRHLVQRPKRRLGRR